MRPKFGSNGGAVTRRIASQGALLFAGFATSQICSFLRNAIIAHTLAKGDFGIAATLTMVLMLVESVTDVGADRLIVQAPDGDTPAFVATAHSVLIGRGLLTSLVLFSLAGPFCRFLDIEDAQRSFELIALVPFIKGFFHLGTRVAQRHLDNWPQMLTEVAPQLAALALTIPALHLFPSYAVVAALSLSQAFALLIVSHAVSKEPYRVAVDQPILMQLLVFGWPIWLSAFPLSAVYQGDRLLIGKFYGMEALAGYSVAFMITMVPALIAAKVGNALMLPLLSERTGNARALAYRFESLSSVTALAAALYFVVFGIAGGTILPLAFGPQYAGLGTLTAWLALMWTVRMLQVVPGMAVMAHGKTQPFLVAGLIRACALAPGLILAIGQYELQTLAMAGAAGELASFAYITWYAGKCSPSLTSISASTNAWLIGVAAAIAVTSWILVAPSASDHIAVAALLSACVTGYAVTSQATLRDGLFALLPSRNAAA